MFPRLFIYFFIALSVMACQPDQHVSGPAIPVKVKTEQPAKPILDEPQSNASKENRPEGFHALREQCPYMDVATIEAILKPASPNRPDYDYYARSYCVPHAEAKRRMALQAEWTSGETAEMVHALMTEITQNEIDTFAGHWIQHTPTYAMAIAFTKDAKKTLAKYTDNPIFVAVDMPGASQRTVERNQFRIMAMLEKLGIPYSSANRDYKTGLFVVQLSVDKEDYIRNLAAKGEIDLPDWVQFKTPPPLPRDMPAPAIDPMRLKAFPQYRHRTEFDMQTSMGVADIQGTLKLVDGCLAFEKEGEVKNIVWQKFHAPDLTEAERLGVMSRYKGDTVFAGEEIVLSGHQPGVSGQVYGANNNPEAWGEIATDTQGACPPPYVMVAGFTSLKEVRRTRIEAKVKHHMKTLKMSRADAAAEARKQELMAEELTALVKDLRKNKRDVFAGALVNAGSAHTLVAAGYGRNSPPAASLFVKGEVDKASLVPPHLIEFVHIQSVPRSLAQGDKDIAFLQEKLGDSADVNFAFFDGSISIDNVSDLKPLSDLRISMGDDWPKHYKVPLINEAASMLYFGPTTILKRYEMQQRAEYQEILNYAERQFPKAAYYSLDQAVQTVMSYGLSDLDEIKRLESSGFSPLTIELDYKAPNRNIKPAIYAEAIVTAEPIAIDTDDSREDGYRSTVTFRVKDNIKGGLQSGQLFKLRMKSGEDENGGHIKVKSEPFLLPSFDYGFADEKDWILFISNRAYDFRVKGTDVKDEPLWILTGRALPGRNSQYTWFNEVLTPTQMRERIKGMEKPENIISYANPLPRPKAATCHIRDGLPEDGVGEPSSEDIMDIGLTVKTHLDKAKYYLACDHEGPQSQECLIEDGGYITWLEGGQRKHIKAEGGFVGVWLVRGQGARCRE